MFLVVRFQVTDINRDRDTVDLFEIHSGDENDMEELYKFLQSKYDREGVQRVEYPLVELATENVLLAAQKLMSLCPWTKKKASATDAR